MLCLAARQWLFQRKENLPVPKLVVLEATLTSNQSLAYLGHRKGLHLFVDHRMSELPGRFESYKLQLSRGLWCTDPPKVIPDVVESMIGVAHIDGGYQTGQDAALNVIAPLLQSISQLLTTDLNDLVGVLHPK